MTTSAPRWPTRCPGAQLARMDLRVALAALLNRCPELRLAIADDQLEWKSGMAVRGPVAPPVGW
jgi:cytochrome P450